MTASRTGRLLAIVIAVAAMAWLALPQAQAPQPPAAAVAQAGAGIAAAARRGHDADALPAFLPPEAAPVVRRILQGGPFPHRQDGGVFGNRERRLPRRTHGHYREYTVPTPGLSHRGARRIVTGGQPPVEWFYTDDHYESFRAFQPFAAQAPQ
ncbi:ribonuclease [Pseudoxanthomonas broegbernensis]|uniref:Ribonuclease n=1 Tax=Pseudoxanthomonas broegbernensis TaxID=83619 RepID=A0A7V8GK23_9GAMM|nr:ribonuclease domain-containing protein [Pseudoxanthomonas broegbernensis]KAF1684732.1 ribonuclease [Pseudoxanthomonas broegbernensis]MBB6066400.1 guanyl-specific ribonuclease Sa [Pseudoxanthomonas broegbernensis]